MNKKFSRFKTIALIGAFILVATGFFIGSKISFAAQTITGTTINGTNFYIGGPIYRTAAGAGYLNGQYSSVEGAGNTSGAIYTIGGTYVPTAGSLNNMYGIGYGYSGGTANVGGSSGVPASRWGMYVASAGTSRIFLDSDTGNIYAYGTVYATSFSGSYSGTMNAANLSAGSFGGNTGGGNYSFPANVGIGTTNPGVPLAFTDSVATKVQLNGNNANGYQWGLAPAVDGGDAMMKFTAGQTSAGEFGFYNTTNARLFIANNGNVGIGTTGPAQKLEVNGNAQIDSNLTVNGGGTVSQIFSLPNTGGAAQWIKLGTFNAAQQGYHIAVKIVSANGYNAAYSQDQVSYIQFKSSNASAVDANGFAGDSWWYSTGPNAVAPSSVKWVANAAGISATTFTLYAYFASYTGNDSFYVVDVPPGTTWTNIQAGGQVDPGAGSASVLIATNEFDIGSKVGIGQAAPMYDLVVAHSLQAGYVILGNAANTANNTIEFANPNTGTYTAGHINYFGPGNLSLVVGGGNVGIGNAAPAYKLDVTGNANISGTLSAATFSGSYSGTMNAANLSSGSFGSNTGGGNYSFPASVTVTTGITSPYLSYPSSPLGGLYGSYPNTNSNSRSFVYSINSGYAGVANHYGISYDQSNNSICIDGNGSCNVRLGMDNGVVTASQFNGSGAGLTGTAASLTAGAANSVAWTNVSGRPTAVSSFTNDSGYITGAGTAALSNGVNQYPNRTDAAWYQINWNNAAAGDHNLYSSAAVTLLSSGYGAIGFNASAWYIQGNATYGLYSNTGLDAAGGLWDAGNRVYSASNVPPISTFSNNSGYITGITSANVTTALGYTPYNSTNPSGYITAGSTLTGLVQSTAAGTSYITGGSVGIGTTGPSYTLQVNGSFAATYKNFVIPDPIASDKLLVHSSIEGPEHAVYYRGEAQLANGQAKVEMPAYFEALTRKDGRTVLLTNVDGFDQLAVKSQGGEEVKDGAFIVYSSNPASSQKFSWEVMAVRADIPVLVPEVPRPAGYVPPSAAANASVAD